MGAYCPIVALTGFKLAGPELAVIVGCVVSLGCTLLLFLLIFLLLLATSKLVPPSTAPCPSLPAP